MRKIYSIIIGLLMGGLTIAATPFPQSDNFKIFQTDKRISIDGELDDWEGINEFPIDLTTTGDKIQPSKNMSVTAKFTYDAKNFYVAVKAMDDTLEFPNRSWRYGDGFFLTFLDPSKGNESDSFYSFGISLVEKKPIKQRKERSLNPFLMNGRFFN